MVKVVMGTLQTASMFMMIGAAGSSLRAAGGKVLGMVDDIAYKNLMGTAETAMALGEAADGLSGGVQALQGVVTGNPVDVLAGVANITMVDLPPGTTKKVVSEAVEEGLEKVTKEAVEKLTGEGVEKITRETIEDVTEEALEHTTREAVEQATGQTVKDVAEEAGEAAGKQTDELIGESVKTAQVIEEPATIPKVDAPSGGRAGQSSAWNEYFGVEDVPENIDRLNRLDVEIEDIRQAVIKADDIDAAMKTLQDLGVPGANAETVEQMKKYLFDSEGIQFTPENYEFWQRLTGVSADPPTFGDASVVAHEMAEMDELKRLLTDAGLPPDPLGYERGSLTAPKWRELFNESYYLPAHSHALEVQHQFVADEVERLLKPANPDLEISFEEIASIDPTGSTEAQNFLRLTDQEGNLLTLKQHPNFQQWSSRGNEIVKLPSEIRETMKISGEQCTLREFIEQLKKLPMK